LATPRPSTGPPDFIGVGTQRSGTTWWFRTLVGHPDVRPPRGRRKELHFFDPFCAREMSKRDIARYHRLFPRADGETTGEWTPRYMRDVWTPRLLQRAAPEAKLLVLVRDPVERFRSGVLHRLTRTPMRRPETLAADAIDRSRYAVQLRRLHAFFDDEQILVLQYERCRADTAGEYRRTLRFLGLRDCEPVDAERSRGTTTAAAKEPLWPDLMHSLRVALEPDVSALAELVPDLDLGLWPNFAHLDA
jgi:hypothetical protein